MREKYAGAVTSVVTAFLVFAGYGLAMRAPSYYKGTPFEETLEAFGREGEVKASSPLFSSYLWAAASTAAAALGGWGLLTAGGVGVGVFCGFKMGKNLGYLTGSVIGFAAQYPSYARAVSALRAYTEAYKLSHKKSPDHSDVMQQPFMDDFWKVGKTAARDAKLMACFGALAGGLSGGIYFMPQLDIPVETNSLPMIKFSEKTELSLVAPVSQARRLKPTV